MWKMDSGLLRVSEHMEAFSEKNVIQIQKIYVNFKRQKDDTTRV